MLPSQWRQVRQQFVVHIFPRIPQCLHRSFQLDRIPQHDGRQHQFEAAGAITLILETAVANFTEPVKEPGSGQRVFGFALVQADVADADCFKWRLVTRLLDLPL